MRASDSLQTKMRFVHLFLISLLILVLAPASINAQVQDFKVITGATIIDGTSRPPVKDAAVVIKGTRISAVGPRRSVNVPQGATVIDARGKYVIPGLADMHNHLGDGTFSFSEGPPNLRKNLARMLASGFTSLFHQGIPNLESFGDLKLVAAADDSPYPHFYGVGVRFAAKGGHGASLGSFTPDSPDEARRQVRELAAAKVDGVKIVYDDLSYVTDEPRPMLKPEVVAAIIDEAHQHGLKAYVHAPVLKYAKEVLRAGADGLVHGIISDPVDDELISLLKRNQAAYITTHAIFYSVADLGAWARRISAFNTKGLIPREVLEIGLDPKSIEQWEARWKNLALAKAQLPILRANVKKLQDAGVLVVLGSDTPSAGTGTGVLLGLASQLELTLLVEAGLTTGEALRTATSNAARMVGREKDLGTIESGKLADMLILDADPLADIGNVRSIHRIVKGGVVYEPAALSRIAD